MVTYISIDCATKSLGYVIADVKIEPGITMADILERGSDIITIRSYGTIDIIPGAVASKVSDVIKARALSNVLDALPKVDDAIVLIENQYKASGEGVVTEHFLTYHFRDHQVVSMDPNDKLNVTFSPSIKRHYTYKSNKAFAVANVKIYNAKHNVFALARKADDMADAFMQMVAHMVRRPVLLP